MKEEIEKLLEREKQRAKEGNSSSAVAVLEEIKRTLDTEEVI